jgi:hypothetical protein
MINVAYVHYLFVFLKRAASGGGVIFSHISHNRTYVIFLACPISHDQLSVPYQN